MDDKRNLDSDAGAGLEEIQPRHDSVHTPQVRAPLGDQELDAAGDGQQAEKVVIALYDGWCPNEFLPYVYGKFKRSLRHGNDYYGLIDQDNFSKAYDAFIPHLISRSVLRFAALSSDADNLLGFSLIENTKLHYVFVQAQFRKMGIGRLLVPTPIDTITHVTKMGLTLWNSKLPNAKFRPF